VHDLIWRDEEVKNIHYILSPKPWDERQESPSDGLATPNDESHVWWWRINNERLNDERTQRALDDGF
jgi:hypothetical protein